MTVSEQQRYLLVKAPKAILSSQHSQAPAEVLINQTTGKIVEIALDNKKCTAVVSEDHLEVIQLDDDQLLMPGLVDAHGKCLIGKVRLRGKNWKLNQLVLISPFERTWTYRMGGF